MCDVLALEDRAQTRPLSFLLETKSDMANLAVLHHLCGIHQRYLQLSQAFCARLVCEVLATFVR